LYIGEVPGDLPHGRKSLHCKSDNQIGNRARFSSGKKSAGDRGIRVARGGGSIGVFGYSCPHGGKLGDNFDFSLRQA